jgi:hypothetical protein
VIICRDMRSSLAISRRRGGDAPLKTNENLDDEQQTATEDNKGFFLVLVSPF